MDRQRDGARLLETGIQFLITTPRLHGGFETRRVVRKLLTMTAITFTWANADVDRRHSTSEVGSLTSISQFS
jgi:hypothetical protein